MSPFYVTIVRYKSKIHTCVTMFFIILPWPWDAWREKMMAVGPGEKIKGLKTTTDISVYSNKTDNRLMANASRPLLRCRPRAPRAQTSW